MFLAYHNEVLCAMFNDTWKEKIDVEIVDTLVSTFEEFLTDFLLKNSKSEHGKY